MSTSMTTITLKLFKPSKLKMEILDEAIVNYSCAFNHLLENAIKELPIIKANFKDQYGRYTCISVKKWLTKELERELNQFGVEPFKDSLLLDFSAKLAGSLSSDRSLKSSCSHSIYFCRYSSKRNYSLLYNPESKRYYAKLYLMNVKNKNRHRPNPENTSELLSIDNYMTPFKETSDKKSYLILPLAFSRYQEAYLEKALSNPKILRTARLYRRKGEYYLTISIENELTETVETTTYLGISRGIRQALNCVVVDKSSEICDSFSYELTSSPHALAKELSKQAHKHKAQLIFENLSSHGDCLSYADMEGNLHLPKISASDYNKLVHLVDYKAQLLGLPKAVHVSSLGIFHTCPKCHSAAKANRFSKELLICTSCAKTSAVDEAGAVNLARRLLKYNSDKIKIRVINTNEGLLFSNADLNLNFLSKSYENCQKDFLNNIKLLVANFYNNFEKEGCALNFSKKLSLIKKIEANSSPFEFVQVF